MDKYNDSKNVYLRLVLFCAIFLIFIYARYFGIFSFNINYMSILLGLFGILLSPEQIIAAIAFCIPFGSVMKIGILCLILILIYLIKTQRQILTFNRIGIIFIVLIVWELLHFVISPFSLSDYIKLAGVYLLIAILFSNGIPGEHNHIIIDTYAVGVISFSGLLLLYESSYYGKSIASYLLEFHRLGMNGIESTELYSKMSISTNFLALCCMMGIASLMYLVWKYKKGRIYRIGMIVMLTAFGMMTYSKSYFVIYVLVILFVILATLKNGKLSKIFMVPFFIIMIFAIAESLFPEYIDLYYETIINRFINGGLSSRDEAFILYMNYLLDNPLALIFGVGLQSTAAKTGVFLNPHAMAVEVAVSFGLLGGILVIYLFARILREGSSYFFTMKNLPVLVLMVMTQSSRLFKNVDSMLLFLLIIAVISLENFNAIDESEEQQIL